MNNYQGNRKNWLRQPFMTYAFLGIQLIVFLVSYLLPSLNIKLWGGMYRDFIIYGQQYWRLLTPIFIHANFEHILFNSLVLYFMGRQVEMIFGHWRYLLIYLFGGILGNLFSMGFTADRVLSMGASSSILGIFGAFLVFGYHFRWNTAIQQLTRNYLLFVVMLFISGLFTPNVDFWAHLGGLLGGGLAGTVVFLPNSKEPYSIHKRITGGLLYIFLAVLCILAALRKTGLL